MQGERSVQFVWFRLWDCSLLKRETAISTTKPLSFLLLQGGRHNKVCPNARFYVTAPMQRSSQRKQAAPNNMHWSKGNRSNSSTVKPLKCATFYQSHRHFNHFGQHIQNRQLVNLTATSRVEGTSLNVRWKEKTGRDEESSKKRGQQREGVWMWSVGASKYLWSRG